MEKNQRYLFTGGPGAGKSTTLEVLRAQGFPCMPEVARTIIRERLDQGLCPRPDPVEFAQQILNADIAQYGQARIDGPVFFDRGIPDALGMLFEAQQIHLSDAKDFLQDHPYCTHVFFFPPWKAIFSQDDERDQSFAESVSIASRAQAWYESLGFTVIPMPLVTPAERASLIIDLIPEL